MRKIIFSVLIIFSTLFFAGISVSAQEQRVFDDAGLFSSSEIDELEEKAEKISQKANMDFVIVTSQDIGDVSPMVYADDFYDYNGFGDDGAIFLINMKGRDIYISTCGIALQQLEDYEISNSLDKIYEYATVGDYSGAADCFLNEMKSEFIKSISALEVLVIIVVAVALFLIIFYAVKHNYAKEAEKQPYPLRKQSTVSLIKKEDLLINTAVTSRVIQSSSGGSSGRSGGSSHRSSSGRSHGGGGRKF